MTYKALLTSLLIVSLTSPALAGKLDDLETQATTKSKSSGSKSSSSKSSSSNSSGGYYNTSQNNDAGNAIDGAILLIVLTVKAIELTFKGVKYWQRGAATACCATNKPAITATAASPAYFEKRVTPFCPP